MHRNLGNIGKFRENVGHNGDNGKENGIYNIIRDTVWGVSHHGLCLAEPLEDCRLIPFLEA